jgi:hypothetical protein
MLQRFIAFPDFWGEFGAEGFPARAEWKLRRPAPMQNADLLADPKSVYGWRRGRSIGSGGVKAAVAMKLGFEPKKIEPWRNAADGFGEPFRYPLTSKRVARLKRQS